MVEEIMRRDHQYFFQVMAQNGTKLPQHFDLSQILEEDPNQVNQANANPIGHNGGNRREHLMPKSPTPILNLVLLESLMNKSILVLLHGG